jgi:hemolysin activation/secretion protein
VAAGVARERPAAAGAYGTLRTRFEVAKVRERFTLADTAAVDVRGASTEQQMIVDARGHAGWALSRAWAAEGRATWQSVDGEHLPVPDSELWYVGGATTVRGYREEQFRGETAAYGGIDLVLGPQGRGQVYAFYDLGWVRRTAPAGAEGTLVRRDRWLHGFGLGLRTPSAAGWVDLSVGFADQLTFDAGKIHLALVQGF